MLVLKEGTTEDEGDWMVRTIGFGITELEDEKSQLVTYYYYVTMGK